MLNREIKMPQYSKIVTKIREIEMPQKGKSIQEENLLCFL